MSPQVSASLLQLLRPASASASVSEGGGKPCSGGDRHFVTWTEEEDEILRQAVQLHGTEKWSLIAAQFQNKTGRQCRRRWLTYLSTACKKGGWSPEEDQMLLEAHRKYGNRWTEIAKVVPGRTDNAVKNRFCALCKKQAKDPDVSSSQSSGDATAEEDRGTRKKRVLGENKDILNKKSRSTYLQTMDESLAKRAHPVRYSPSTGPDGRSRRITVPAKNTSFQGTASVPPPKIPPGEPVSAQGMMGGGMMIAPMPTVSVNNPSSRWADLNQDKELFDSLVERCSNNARWTKYVDGSEKGWKVFDWADTQNSCKEMGNNCLGLSSLLPVDNRESVCGGKGSYPYPPFPDNLLWEREKENCPYPPHADNLSWERQISNSCLLNVVGDGWNGVDSVTLDDHDLSLLSILQGTPTLTDAAAVDTSSCTQISELFAAIGGEPKLVEPSLPTSSFVDMPSSTIPNPFFSIDGMPSPQFSDSERQFLLSALDLGPQFPLIESTPPCCISMSSRTPSENLLSFLLQQSKPFLARS